MVFLSNYLVFKIVLAALGRVDYPVAGDLELKYDTANKIYLSGGSLDYVDDITLYTTIGGETTTHVIPQSPRIEFNNESKLVGTGTGGFGTRVSIDGDYVAISDSYIPSGKGTVYIYHRSGTTWSLQHSFTGPSSSDYMEAVAISGDYVMAGARYGDAAVNNGGEVLVYKRSGTTWTNTQTLTASDAADSDHFGSSITLKDNCAVVGTDQVSGAYVFTLSNGTWSETQLLTTGTNSDLFGNFVKLTYTDLLIGARGVNSLKGTAYIYTNNGGTFTQQAQITPDDLVGTDWFGRTGDIFGDYACVGAPYQNTSTGAAYIFKRSGTTWTQQQKLTASNSATNTRFGRDVHLMSDDTVIIGAHYDDAKGGDAGAAYLFQRTGDTWSEIKIIYPSDIGANDNFGFSISSSETDLVISGPTLNNHTGQVYFWPLTKTRNFYITDAGKYSVDATIAGLKYKTNELDITSVTIPTKVVQVSAGGFGQSMALTEDGSIYMWGDDGYGQMGQGTTDTNVNTPVKVKGVGGSGFLSNITKISCGGYHCLALASDGTLYAWGNNSDGQIGDGTYTERKTPVTVSYSGDAISNISAGWLHSALTTTTGKVYCWGMGTSGQIGDNQSSSDRTSPTQVVGVGNVGTLTGIRDVTCGDSVTHAIKDSDGTLYGWGKNYYGMVGNGAGAAASSVTSPVVAIFASDSSAVTGITQISVGGDHVTFLKSDGTVYGAGYNGLGQIGDGTISDAHNGLVQVLGVGGSGNLTDITQIASCDSTSLALKSDGTMYSWGNNVDGQNGLGTVGGTNPSTPVAITLLTGVNTVGRGGRSQHFISTKPDGSVFCWGQGSDGQIGDGTNTADQGTPTQVLAGAGPSIDGKFNLFTEPRLTFDGYNKLSLLHGLSSVSSKLFLGSNVYDIGTLTSDLTIETPGLYRGLVYDTSSNVAYFNKTTVGSITTPLNTHGTFVQSWGSNFWTTTKDLGAHTSSMSFGGWVDLSNGSRAISINDDSAPLNDSETKDWHLYIANYSTSDHLFSMRHKGDGEVIYFRANTTGEESFPIGKHKDGALTHFVVTTELVSGTYYVSLYSNGQFIAKKTWSSTGGSSVFNVKNFRIGKHDYAGTNHGSFSRMFFYSGTLSDSDVNKIYHNYVPKTTGNCVLKCYFPFQNGLNDESGNNNHLVEVGTTNPWPSYTITPEIGVYPGFFNIQGYSNMVYTLYYDNKLYEITVAGVEYASTTSESHYHPSQVLDPKRAFIAGTGGWKSQNNVSLPAYLTIKLPEAKYISNMFIRERESNGGISGSAGNGDAPYEIINAWEIEASTDGTTWSSKHSDTGIGNSGKDFALDTPGTFQYWRIKVSSLNVPGAYGSNGFFGIFYWDIVARNFTRDGPHVTTLAKVYYDLKSAPATVGNTPDTTTGITYTNDGAVHDTGSSSLNFSWTSDNDDVFSVSFLAKNLGSSQSYFVRSTANSSAPEFEAYLAGSTNIWARSRNDSLDQVYFRVDTSDWTHYVYVHSPVFRGLYINGALVSRRFSTLGGTSGQTTFYSSTSSMFNAGGVLSEFRAFSNVLDQHQIQELYDYDMPNIPIQPDPITFDGYNKLSLSGLTNPTSKIHALPTGAETTTVYDIGTATNMYIEDAGTYTAEMKGSDGFVLDSNVVGALSSAPVSFTIFPSSIVLGGWWGTNWSGSNYSKTSNTSTKIVYDLSGGVTAVLNGTQYGITFNATTTGIELDLNATGQNDTPYTFTSPTITTAVTSGIITVGQSISVKAANGLEEATFTVPDFGYKSGNPTFLNFDGFNKYTFTNADTGSTYKLKYESNTYDLGTISNVYISNPGTYSAEIKGATNFALSSNVVTGDITPDLSLSENIISINKFTTTNASEMFGHADAKNHAFSKDNSIFVTSSDTADGNSGNGKVFIYKRGSDGTYTLDTTLNAVTGGTNNFGHSLDINDTGTRLVISEPGISWTNGEGRIHVYDRASTSASWPSTPTTTLNTSTDTGSHKGFGYDLALSGDGNTIGTSTYGGANYHRAYIFEYSSSSWSETKTWSLSGTSDVGATCDLSHDGTRFVVGSFTASGTKWYLFDKTGSTWAVSATEHTLASASRANIRISGNGNVVFVGMETDASCEIWEYDSSWSRTTTLTETTNFGCSMASNYAGTIFAIGESSHNSSQGRVFIYSKSGSTITLIKTLVNPDAGGSQWFGTTGGLEIDYYGHILAVNAPGYNSSKGKVELFANPAPPSLDFDGYNKLTFSGLESGTTSNVTFDGKTYSIGTASNVYIENTGTYDAESKGTTTFALTSNVVGAGQISTPPVYSSVAPAVVTPINFTSGGWAGQHYFVYRGDVVQNGITHYHWNLDFQSGNTPVNYSVLYDYVNRIWKDGDGSTPFYMSPSAPLIGTNLSVTNPVNVHGFDTDQTSEYFGFPNPYYQAPKYTPSLTHDGYKLVVKNIFPTSTTLKYGSNTYEIGTATNIYVENTGDYTAEIGGAADFAFTSNTVSGTIKTIEPGFASRYQGSMALTYDGKLYAWGMNDDGEAGVGTSSDITVPTLCTGITQGTVAKLLSGSDITDNSRGEVSAIKTTDGKIYMAGKGDNNCIPGKTSDQTSFTDVTSYFGDQSLSANTVTMMSFTDESGAALTETGNVWTWGTHDSEFKKLGQASASTSSTPKQINFSSATDNITKITSGHYHTVALDSSGDVWFWGKNGINSTSWPSSITDEPQKVVDGKNIIGLASSYGTMYAWDATGKMWNAGNNYEGQIGDGTTTANSSGKTLTEVTYFSSNNITINKVYGGGYFVFADTSDGYYCWGNGGNGVLGNGGTGSITSGPAKWTNVSNIKKFMASTNHASTITEDGKYYAWGAGTNYERGDNDTGAISYPKYIDTLPNILAPSFEFDGYDKVFVNRNKYIFTPSVLPAVSGAWAAYYEYRHKETDGIYEVYSAWYFTQNPPRWENMPIAVDTTTNTWIDYSSSLPPTSPVENSDGTISLSDHAGIRYVFKKPTVASWLSPKPQSTKYTKGTTTYDVGKPSIITVPDPGTYDAQIKFDTDFILKSETVPATSSSGLYTWAFHHGNFDNAYGDGDILTARDNGRFYADTPAYTSASIGTITPIAAPSSFVYEFYLNADSPSDPHMTEISSTDVTLSTSNLTLESGWQPSNGATDTKTHLFDGDLTATKETAFRASRSVGQKLLTLTTNTELTNLSISSPQPKFAPGWKIILNDTHTLVNDTSNNGTSSSPAPFTKSYTFSSNYLSSTHGTTYTFAPPSGGLTANVLMVAGGGGGGGRYSCGGGGAGGLVYTAGTSLANGATKTIVVGNGDSGGVGDSQNGFTGKDTTFTGLDNALGGGYGGTQGNAGGTGGSGGGGGGQTGNGTGGSATSGQGFAGGTGSTSGSYGGAGGGGAGAVGGNGSNGVGGNGGIGKFFGTESSFTNFGDEYGEGGYFAGGAGGGTSGGYDLGIPGRGGGGYGQGYDGYMGRGGSQHGMVHTGGGGGGGGTPDRDQHRDFSSTGDGGVTAHGGRGGSGIVLIQTNVAPPNGANTAVVQVGNPRRRSLPPTVDAMGSEVNRAIIIHGDSMPTYKLPTHWYWNPVGSSSNDTLNSGGGDKFFLVKRPDGITSNVFYIGQSTSGELIEYGTKMAQTADAVFMPVESQNYDTFLSLGSGGNDDIHLGMNSSGVAALRRTSGGTDITVGTIECFTVGKWHHVTLTVDSEGNAIGYVNGYPVVTGTHASMPDVGSRSSNNLMRVGLGGTFRKSLTYEASTYNFLMSPKQVLQRAAEVGLGPKLEYDGLNTIKILNTEPGSSVKLFTSNVEDTSNVFIVADPAAGEYTVPEAGKYYAEIKGTDTFTVTKTLDVSGTFPLYQYPPYDGTTSSLTQSASADTWNTWTISGASNGNGQYQAKTTHSTDGTNYGPYRPFNNDIDDGVGQLVSTTKSNFGITLQLPSAKTIRKYRMYPVDHTLSGAQPPGSSTDPTLPGNSSEDAKARPNSWVLKGSSDGTNWTDLDTVTNKPISIYGDVYSIDSPASYQYYQMFILNVVDDSQTRLRLGEWQLWGDA